LQQILADPSGGGQAVVYRRQQASADELSGGYDQHPRVLKVQFPFWGQVDSRTHGDGFYNGNVSYAQKVIMLICIFKISANHFRSNG
jgi:hypothetical protein